MNKKKKSKRDEKGHKQAIPRCSLLVRKGLNAALRGPRISFRLAACFGRQTNRLQVLLLKKKKSCHPVHAELWMTAESTDRDARVVRRRRPRSVLPAGLVCSAKCSFCTKPGHQRSMPARPHTAQRTMGVQEKKKGRHSFSC